MIIDIRNARGLSLLAAMFLIAGLTDGIVHAAKPDCTPWPACKDDGTEPPPPDPGGSADPQVVYRDGGIYLANADGTSQTQIRSSGGSPKLDLLNKRVLLIDSDELSNDRYMAFMPFTVEDGDIGIGEEIELISGIKLGGNLSSEGVSDWSPDGTKYSYSYWTGGGNQAVYRMMVAPDPELDPGGTHSLAYESEVNGGLNSATWDASGDFIFHNDNPLDGSVTGGLFVIDVRTFPGKTANAISLGPVMASHGYPAPWNVQSMSASYETGFDHQIDGEPGAYSFDPDDPNVPASSDTSLCLMISVIDWSASRAGERFVVILDLVHTFDLEAWAAGLRCSTATMPVPILDFQGSDFTTGDAGIVGTNSGKGKPGGIWIHDLADGTRSKIISEGGSADWSN